MHRADQTDHDCLPRRRNVGACGGDLEDPGIEGIWMTIKIEEIGMVVINDTGASETFVEMGRTAANERGPNHQDGTTVTVKIRQLSRRYTDESTNRCYARQ